MSHPITIVVSMGVPFPDPISQGSHRATSGIAPAIDLGTLADGPPIVGEDNSGPPVGALIGTTTLVERLLPASTDDALDNVANTVFLDGDLEIKLSPIDQLLMTFSRHLLNDPEVGRAGIIQLPRCRHQLSILLAVCCQLLCRRPPSHLTGPVVLVGFDIDMGSRLRGLAVRNYRRMGLSNGNPLSAYRLTGTGALAPIVGSTIGQPDGSFIYFNTRVGSPRLACEPALVIIDATSIVSPLARKRALEWSCDLGAAAIVAVCDLGDEYVRDSFEDVGFVPTILALSSSEFSELEYTLGRQNSSPSLLSSMGYLTFNGTSVQIRRVPPGTVNNAILQASEAIGSRPRGSMAPELDLHLRLLRNGTRLAARYEDYVRACTYNARAGEMPLPYLLDRKAPNLGISWRSWATAKLGSLIVALKSLWKELQDENPKLLELWNQLEDIERRNQNSSILIRCHSRAAMEATKASLSTGVRSTRQEELWKRIRDRVKFATFKERFAAGTFDIQVLTAAPPPWLMSIFLGVEARYTCVLCYTSEESALRSHFARWAKEIETWRDACCRSLGATVLPKISNPMPETSGDDVLEECSSTLNIPSLDLIDILDRASRVIGDTESESVRAPSAGSTQQRECLPVLLDDGRTWWCINEGDGDTPVVTVTITGPRTRRVRDIEPGMQIIVPAGEGVESVHARLVAASRNSDEVRNLDRLLSQFRTAARTIRGIGTQAEAIERVRMAGASAFRQLPLWESGETIAPRDPDDVAAVFRAASLPCPDLGLLYEVAVRLRGLNQVLGKFVGAIATGRGGDTLDKLRELVGPGVDEIIDEFSIVTVNQVGQRTRVDATLAGKVAR